MSSERPSDRQSERGADRADKNTDKNTEYTGAEILVKCLAEEGVKHVFGYPGGAVLYIYDAIFNQRAMSILSSI